MKDEEERRYERNMLEQIFNETYPDSEFKNIIGIQIWNALIAVSKKPKIAKKIFSLMVKCAIHGGPNLHLLHTPELRLLHSFQKL